MFHKRGWFNTLSAEFAEPGLGSQSQFTRYEAALRYFYPLFGPFVLRLKGEGGYISSRDAKGVPIFERYFLGGIYDIRGFSLYSLGPKVLVADDPNTALRTFQIGGNLRVVAKAEIEVPIFEKMNIRGVIFTDIGNSYNLEKQYCRNKPSWADVSVDPCVALTPLSSLRSSWGFGFRWFSPIGPLRFEWGLPYKTLPGEQGMVFEFTIGNEL
jgi:outer membrane protein insertion porin family